MEMDLRCNRRMVGGGSGKAALLVVILSMSAGLAQADSTFTETRTVTKLADGVYTIRHIDPFPGWVHGNTTVIIGEREVFVVDSTQMSYSAREDIAQIREWTSKPVHYLLNTHWHQDHNGGNKDYMDAFSGLVILAHPATREMIANTSPNVGAEMLKQAAEIRGRLQHRLETGKTDDGKPLTEAKKTEYGERLKQLDRIEEEAKSFTFALPTLTFEHELDIDLGSREVQVMHLGRGNTAGDAVAYLPKEKILITGDLLVSPVPYAFDGYPKEWIRTLERMEHLEADTIVPGHGDVMHDKTYLRLVIEMMKSIVSQVEEQLRHNNDATLEEVLKAVDVKPFVERFAGGDKSAAGFFEYSIGQKFIELAYHEAQQR